MAEQNPTFVAQVSNQPTPRTPPYVAGWEFVKSLGLHANDYKAMYAVLTMLVFWAWPHLFPGTPPPTQEQFDKIAKVVEDAYDKADKVHADVKALKPVVADTVAKVEDNAAKIEANAVAIDAKAPAKKIVVVPPLPTPPDPVVVPVPVPADVPRRKSPFENEP